MKPYTEKFKKQRKLLLVLPLLTLPFVTMTFWALGGGSAAATTSSQPVQQGFNAKLPDARLKDGNMDKMSLYSLAQQNAAKDPDPYGAIVDSPVHKMLPEDNPFNYQPQAAAKETGDIQISKPDPNEVRVRSKLDQLREALNRTSPDEMSAQTALPDSTIAPGGQDNRLAQLQQMMAAENQTGNPDPEMSQLDGMLEKILDIEHPDRVQEKLRQQSLKNQGEAFAVGVPKEKETADLFSGAGHAPGNGFSSPVSSLDPNGFYDLEDHAAPDNQRPAITAVIHQQRTLVSGATVKMRLTEDVYINGIQIPKGNFVFGTCNVAGERLTVQVKNIRFGNNILPVSLSVYDLDGLEGVDIPGAITRDAAKSGADQAVQGLQFMSMDPSFGAQAAGAGIEAAKSLLGRKAKLVRVTVKAGYPVLLVDQKALQH